MSHLCTSSCLFSHVLLSTSIFANILICRYPNVYKLAPHCRGKQSNQPGIQQLEVSISHLTLPLALPFSSLCLHPIAAANYTQSYLTLLISHAECRNEGWMQGCRPPNVLKALHWQAPRPMGEAVIVMRSLMSLVLCLVLRGNHAIKESNLVER